MGRGGERWGKGGGIDKKREESKGRGRGVGGGRKWGWEREKRRGCIEEGSEQRIWKGKERKRWDGIRGGRDERGGETKGEEKARGREGR